MLLKIRTPPINCICPLTGHMSISRDARLPISRWEYTRQKASSLTMRSMCGFSRCLHNTNESLEICWFSYKELMMLPTVIQPWWLPLAITTLALIPLSCLLVTKAPTRLLLTLWSPNALQDLYCNKNDNDKSQQVNNDECCRKLQCWWWWPWRHYWWQQWQYWLSGVSYKLFVDHVWEEKRTSYACPKGASMQENV